MSPSMRNEIRIAPGDASGPTVTATRRIASQGLTGCGRSSAVADDIARHSCIRPRGQQAVGRAARCSPALGQPLDPLRIDSNDLGAGLIADGLSDEALIAHIRQRADTNYHPVETCCTRHDAIAVVDPALRLASSRTRAEEITPSRCRRWNHGSILAGTPVSAVGWTQQIRARVARNRPPVVTFRP